MTQPLWKPSTERIEESNMKAFMRFVQETFHPPGLADFQSLYRWSVEQPEQFWESVWRFCDVKASRHCGPVVTDFGQMPGARWFPDSRLNFAENLLRYHDDREALVFWSEKGRQSSLTYAGLHAQVAPVAASLRTMGLSSNDRVAAFMPNMPETVVAMLAAASIGAAWSSCSPDFGLQGAFDRFGQIQPKILFTADGYLYNGKIFDSLERVSRIAERIPSLERVVVIPYTRPKPKLNGIPGAVRYEDLLAGTTSGDIDYQQLPFDHPVYILYSSGTTGPPKSIIHGAGGTLIQHLKELTLHTDLKRSDRILYFTTSGWMMWNWLVSSLAVGATVVLYDGSPFHPDGNILFDLAEQEKLTILGVSARYISAAERAGIEPDKTHNLSQLHTILSTGSPLSGRGFDYVYQKVKKDVCLSSISGGTDIIAGFAVGNPIGPVFRGEIQTRALGMTVEVFDGQGQSVRGEKGELVCTAPFPSMPVGFWNDPDGGRYRAAYFQRFPSVWHHGDYCQLTVNDGMIIWGRSDTVLNPGGVRIGTAEVYRPLEALPDILEAVAVCQDWEGDVRLILFLILDSGVELDEELRHRIKRAIRESASPRHVPAKILAVSDIPRTLNGKVAEMAVRNVIRNKPVHNRDALANPEALQLFEDLPELQS